MSPDLSMTSAVKQHAMAPPCLVKGKCAFFQFVFTYSWIEIAYIPLNKELQAVMESNQFFLLFVHWLFNSFFCVYFYNMFSTAKGCN